MTRSLLAPLAATLLGLLLLGAYPFSSATFTLVQEVSTMEVEGTSTLHDWSCPVATMSGAFQIDTTAAEATPVAALQSAQVTVPVEAIACENGTMRRKLRDALAADDHPAVTYTLTVASLRPLPDSSAGWFAAETTGDLTIAGRSNPIEMTVQGLRQPDGQIRFVGQHTLALSAFEIDRPSAMLGTIKTGDDITIHFDVVAAP